MMNNLITNAVDVQELRVVRGDTEVLPGLTFALTQGVTGCWARLDAASRR